MEIPVLTHAMTFLTGLILGGWLAFWKVEL